MESESEIRVGDRWEIVQDALHADRPAGSVWEAMEREDNGWKMRRCDEPAPCQWWVNNSLLVMNPHLARRLPRPSADTSLKPGDVIRDPALLKAGMRVYTGVRPAGYDNRLVVQNDGRWITFSDGGMFREDSVRRGEGWERVTFLGYATPLPAPAPTDSGHGAERADGDSVVAPFSSTAPAGDGQKPALSPAPHAAPAVPFKRHRSCGQDHSQPVLCLTCEGLISKKMAAENKGSAEEAEDNNGTPDQLEASRWRSSTWSPRPSGLGGMVCGGLGGRR